jgi:hypothetical protein
MQVRYETSVVYLEQVPKLSLDTGFDLATFLSFLVTVIIFVLGTWLAIRNSNKNTAEQRRMFDDSMIRQDASANEQRDAFEKTIRSQERTLEVTIKSQESIARSNAVKVSRQDWINELRNSCAKYISTVLVISLHAEQKKSNDDFAEILAKTDPARASELLSNWHNELSRLRTIAYEQKYKIELLSNPSEVLFQNLCAEVLHAIRISQESPQDVIISCDKITSLASEILKIEWDKTKNMQ